MRALIRRVAAFNVMALSALVVNEAVFLAVLKSGGDVLAGIAGIAAAAGINYIVSGTVIFRRQRA